MMQVFWIVDNVYVIKLKAEGLQKVKDLQHGPVQTYSAVLKEVIERGLIELAGELPENRSKNELG